MYFVVVHPKGIAYRKSPNFTDRFKKAPGPEVFTVVRGNVVRGTDGLQYLDTRTDRGRMFIPFQTPDSTACLEPTILGSIYRVVHPSGVVWRHSANFDDLNNEGLGASSGELVHAERVVRGDDGFSYIETKSAAGLMFIPTKTREELPVLAPENDSGHSSAHSSPEASASLTTVDRFTQQNEAYQALLAVIASKLKLCREIVSHFDANGDGIMQAEELRLLVKHLDPEMLHIPQREISLGDQKIKTLQDKPAEQLVQYLSATYDEPKVRMLHQFLGLTARAQCSGSAAEPGVYRVVWSEGIRYRYSPSLQDIVDGSGLDPEELLEPDTEVPIAEIVVGQDKREYGHVSNTAFYLPIRFDSGEPMMDRVADLPEDFELMSYSPSGILPCVL